MPVLKAFRRSVKRTLLEAELRVARRRLPQSRPSVCVFPSNQPWDAASNLRAWLIAPELERLGWRVLVVPEPLSLAQRHRFLELEKPDAILMQQTRHLLNQPKLYPGYPCIVDADDADYLDPKHQARIQESATDAAAVIGGSRFVASCLGAHNPSAYVLWTCTPRPAEPPKTHPLARGPIVTWAHASPLGYQHEAEFVREVMTSVFTKTRGEFWLFGADEDRAQSWFAPLRAAGGVCKAIPSLRYDAYLSRVAESSVGLQPVSPEHEFSRGKSFGKLLAYLSGQVAVVASRAVDHPLFFRHGDNGYLPDHTVTEWTSAIVDLLTDPERRCRVATRGWDDFGARLTSDFFASRLDAILRKSANLPLEPVHEAHLAECALRRKP